MNYPDRNKKNEIYAVVLTGIMKFIFMDWLNFRVFYIVAACSFWIIYIYRTHRNFKDIYNYWGFRRKNLKLSFLILSPFALTGIGGILIYGSGTGVKFLNWHILPILLLYPLWGLLQQFIIAGLVAGNLKNLEKFKMTETGIILFTSVIFALVHYPDLLLMSYVFGMEIVFLKVYLRWNNLWPLGLYHGWVSGLFLYYVIGRDLWSELWIIF